MLEDDENESEYEYEEETDELDLHSMLETFFVEQKKNRNIVDVMCEIKRSFETHNRILNAIYELMNTHFTGSAPPETVNVEKQQNDA